MYGVIRRYVGNQQIADAISGRGDEVKSIVQEIPGFVAYYIIQANDGAASVTIYEDRTGVEESNRRVAQWVRDNLPDAATMPPEISEGEVVVMSAAAAARA